MLAEILRGCGALMNERDLHSTCVGGMGATQSGPALLQTVFQLLEAYHLIVDKLSVRVSLSGT